MLEKGEFISKIENKAHEQNVLGSDSEKIEVNKSSITSESIREQAKSLHGSLQEQCYALAFELEKLEDERDDIQRFLGIKNEKEFYLLPEVELLKKEVEENAKWPNKPRVNYLGILKEIKEEENKFKSLISQN